MSILKPFQLLELNIISAQDLEPVSKKTKTYATAWVHPTRKLSTRVDEEGNNNPTWNDKFVFRVDDEFLRRDSSAVMIEIRSGGRWFGDSLVGTVRVLVGNLIPPPVRHHHHHHLGMRFVALQVRRPSGRPQGILNIGVALLDSSMRSMPLYTHLSTSAVGYRDLMGEDEAHPHHKHQFQNQPPVVKPILRRSRSERSSERVTFDNISTNNGSTVAVPQKKGAKENDSLILSSGYGDQPLPLKVKGKKGKASSVISGAELKEKQKPKGKRGKSGSVLSDSVVSKDSPKGDVKFDKPIPIVIGPGNKTKFLNDKLGSELSDKPTTEVVEEKPVKKSNVAGNENPVSTFNGYEFGGPKPLVESGKFVFGGPPKASSILSGSEVGPSPSEVAAAIAERRYPLDEEKSSVLDGWSVDESVEGLRSKLERWRTELPPLYDRGFSSSSFRSSSQHIRRHTDGGNGLFSCFGNIFGYECQCVCGRPPSRERPSARFQSP